MLQAARRVDWRFLLPCPDSKDVLYVGREGGSLVESLRLFSTSLTVVTDARGLDALEKNYDVVVTSEPSHASLPRIIGKIAPGGWLYVEARRRFRLGVGWPGDGRKLLRDERTLCHAPDYAAALRRLGLEEVAAHWHWPNLEACLEIVPLADRPAVVHSLARRTGGRLARLKAALGYGLLRTGLLARLVPYFSVVGRSAH